MAEKTNVPEIRFAGFTDPWEQRKLGDVANIKTGDSDLQDAVPNGLYPFFVRSDKVERSNRYLFDGEAILVPGEGRLGEIFHYINGKFDYHQRVYKISNFVDVDAKFAMYSMMYGFKKHALENTAKATVDSIRLPTLTEFKFRVPCRDEQYQINVFFSRLDNLITLHQRKYDKLCAVKKSMLDKMFPKPGEIEPEIRFAGFTDPWEQRKLGDIATIVGGGTPSTNNDAYWDGDIDWYSPAELGEQVYADRSVRRITQAGYDSCSATLLPAGKTILFTSRAGIGNTAILRRSACTNQGFQSLVMNDDIDVYFVYSMTDRIKKFAEQKASGSTFLEISGKGLAAGEFVFPSKDEQTAIGSMFKQLDHLITLHQRELNLLKNTKKSLLDKMFV